MKETRGASPPLDLSEIATPALILDLAKLEANVARMRDHVRALGIPLRPHVKTAKSLDVLKLLSGGTTDVPITVSTLAEARAFFAAGVRDILYAVGIAPAKLPQVADLIRAGCTLRVILDSVEAAQAVSDFAGANAIGIEALIEIDSDGRRAGVAPDDDALLAIAAALTSRGHARLAGVMSHAGGSYGCRDRAAFEAMAEQERALTVVAAERLRAAGFACPIVSVGSTPTVHYARSMAGVTEVRAGVFVFGDLVQAQLGTCAMDDIAISVLTSVIGRSAARGEILVDAGFLALSRDRGTADFPVDWGYGAVCDARDGHMLDDVVVQATNQEHGMIAARSGALDLAAFAIGLRLRVLPNHACATAAAHDFYYVTDGGGRVLEKWDRVNGW